MKQPRTDQNRSLLFRFVTSYSSILLFVLVLGFFFMFSLSSTYRSNTYQQNNTLFENGVKDMDTALHLFSTLTTQISSNETIKNLSYLGEDDKTYTFYAQGKESMDYLANLMSVQDMLPINSFYVYLPETDYFLSPSQFASKELFYFQRTALSEELEAKRDALIASYDNVMMLLPFSDYATTPGSTYLYKIPLAPPAFSTSYRPGIACFELNQTALSTYFDEVLTSSTSLLYVTDKNDNFIFSIGNSDFFSTRIESLIQLANSADTKKQPEEFKHQRSQFTITKTVSSYNNWNYYLIQPTDYLLNDLSAYQMTYVFAIVAVCIISFLMIFSLSRANLKPFKIMTDRLETSHQENALLQEKNTSLQDALTKQRPLVYSAYVARIMKGAVSTEQDIQEINDFLKIKGLGQLHFHVLLVSLRLEQIDSLNRYQLQEYEALLYRCFYHYFGSDILIYHPDVNNFALLLSAQTDTEDPSCVENIRTTFSELHKYLLNEHSLWVFGGLGDSNTKLPYFWKSYQQAFETVTLLPEDSIFQSYRELRRNSETYYYPYEMAGQLTRFIKDANTVQIEEIFKLITRENIEYRSISQITLQWLLSDLRTTLVKIRQSLTSNEDTSRLSEFDNHLTEEETLDGIRNLALLLASCFKKKPEGNQLILNIQSYIGKNYYDPDLSLKKISEVFSISESYFSYLFKAETGRNFSEYLEEIRMKQALHLIRETDTPLSELYSHLGYNNPNTFRRAFKKVYGSSPKAFRTAEEDSE
ncbi:MAG: helix-turn-helix domain-containing protein [Lachnospiraceae bacterium]|nr:helix-turn-helix domain-containing protein [Lachnospiraceae bacterium]